MSQDKNTSKTAQNSRTTLELAKRVLMRASGFVFLLLLILAIHPAFAQTGQGAITGRVTDSTGAVVKGATVHVTNTATAVTQTTTTNRDGIYNVQSLNPGDYSVTVVAPGFSTEIVNQVTVNAAEQPQINVALKIGEESTQVTVSAESALLSMNTDVTTTVDHQIVEDLPYPDRSSLEAVELVGGVSGDPGVPGGVFSENPVITTGAVVPGASLTVGGAAPGTTSIMADGSDIIQPSYSRSGVNLSGRVVQETTVITTGLSAKYGRTGGGIIVQTTRSGTNEYHGAVNWRHTDPYFNAYPLGGTLPNNQHETYLGFYLGGPVWIPKVYRGRDKTFFYVAIEPARLRNQQGYRGAFDTPDDLAGHLHNALALLNQSTLKTSGYAAAVSGTHAGGIYDQTGNTKTAGQIFPMGTYKATASSQNRIVGPLGADDLSVQLASNPFAQLVNSYLPTPTNSGPYIQFDNANATYQNDGTNASYARGVIDNDNRYSFRIDHQFNNANQIWGRFTAIPITGTRFFALPLGNPLNQVPTDTIVSHDLAFGYTHIFSGSIVNELHYSVMRVREQRLPYASALTKDWAGSNGLTPATLGKGFPALGTLGTSTLQVAAETPYGQVDQNFIVGDNLTWTHGSHLFQFGADIRWIQSNQYDTSLLYGGKYSFGAGQTASQTTQVTPQYPNDPTGSGVAMVGDAMGTFLLGTISSYSAAPASVPGYYRWRYFAGYFQDSWRMTPKLTLDLGVRYDVETPRKEKFNNQPFLQLTGPSTAQMCFAGSCGTDSKIWPINWYGIQPRIGIAYAPTPRTTIRLAYGILKLPLTGYENLPDPNLNLAGSTVQSNGATDIGGVTANQVVNYMTNPVAPLTSAYTALAGGRGPFLTSSTGIQAEYAGSSSAVPYTQNYSVTAQYQPTQKILLQVTYKGLKGTHLIGASPFSSASPFTGALNAPTLSQVTNAIQNNVYLAGNDPNGNPYHVTNGLNGALLTETYLQDLNPYQAFFNQSLTVLYPRGGASSYNAMYVNFNYHRRDLSLLASYQWSKSIDDVPDVNLGNSGSFGAAPQQNPLNTQGEKSVSTFDVPSRLKVGYTYNLPIGKGYFLSLHKNWLNQLIGNISTAGIITAASGFPNFVTLGSNGYFYSFNSKGVSSALPAGYTLRPDIVPGVPLINKNWKPSAFTSTFTPYLNPAAFATPGSLNAPALGNAPRTLPGARSPREFFFDARVSKGFIVRRYQFNVFANFQNVFNHPVYMLANATASGALQTAATTNAAAGTVTFNPASTTFGKLNGNTQNLSRVIRVGAELTF